jgi:L-amino acid N-acyltransferase YncA
VSPSKVAASEIVIRPAAPADAPAIAQIHVDTWRDTYTGLMPEQYLISRLDLARREGEWQSKLSRRSESEAGVGWPVVAVVGDAVVGVAHGGPNRGTEPAYDGELYLIYIRREAQRWGLGRRLTAAVVADLVGRGLSSMIVWVLADNPSRLFYEALGGIVVGSKDVAVDTAVLKETAYGWPRLSTLQERLK